MMTLLFVITTLLSLELFRYAIATIIHGKPMEYSWGYMLCDIALGYQIWFWITKFNIVS